MLPGSDPAGRGGLPSRFELTVVGKVAVTFLVILFCWALLRGNNPVLFVVSCLLATVLLSMLLTYFGTGRLDVRRSLPERVFAGAPFDVRLLVRNRSAWRPALGLGFKDAIQVSPTGEFICGPVLPVLPPRGEALLGYRKRIHRRGVYRIANFVAASSFPFALFERRVLLQSAPARLVVLPSLGHLRRAAERNLAVQLALPLVVRRSREGQEEFESLRDYRPGENPRLIHWKTSARARKLMRRVMQAESTRDLNVLLDTCVAGLGGEERLRHLEKAVSCAATLMVEAARRGRRASVHFPDGSVHHHGNVRAVIPALEGLAGVRPGRTAARALAERAQVPHGARAILLSLEGPALSAQRAAATRGVELQIWDVSAPSFARYFRRRTQ
jgi:uncharacterized protein (DUF58 family)